MRVQDSIPQRAGSRVRANAGPGHCADGLRLRMRQTMVGGALGGGVMLAGFGLIPALVGAGAGAALGYLVERRARTERASRLT